MLTYKLQAYVKTLSGTSAQQLSATPLNIPLSSLIQADTGDTVYISGDSSVTSSTGFQIPTTPIKLSDLLIAGSEQYVDLSRCYVVGGDGDVVRILYAKGVKVSE